MTDQTETRRPTVGGIAGGVGATTIAHLIDADDAGVIAATGQRVDVLVTRSTAVAVTWAVQTAGDMKRNGSTPVLVVVAHSPGSWPRVVEQRLRMAATNLDTEVLRLEWCHQLAAAENPWEVLADSVYAEDRRKYRWSDQARQFRDDLIDAVVGVLSRDVDDGSAGHDAARVS